MFLLRKQNYQMVDASIKELRKNYPMRSYEIRMAADALTTECLRYAEPITIDELVDGERYGQLSFSDMATAFEGGNGRELRNHGDVYVTVWTWSAEYHRFWCQNAWGGIAERQPVVMAQPLIELP